MIAQGRELGAKREPATALVLRIKSRSRRACGRVEARYERGVLSLHCNCGRELCEHRLAVLQVRTSSLANFAEDAQRLIIVGDWARRAGFGILLDELDRCARAVRRLETRAAADETPLEQARDRAAWVRGQLAQGMQDGLGLRRLPPQQLALGEAVASMPDWAWRRTARRRRKRKKEGRISE